MKSIITIAIVFILITPLSTFAQELSFDDQFTSSEEYAKIQDKFNTLENNDHLLISNINMLETQNSELLQQFENLETQNSELLQQFENLETQNSELLQQFEIFKSQNDQKIVEFENKINQFNNATWIIAIGAIAGPLITAFFLNRQNSELGNQVTELGRQTTEIGKQVDTSKKSSERESLSECFKEMNLPENKRERELVYHAFKEEMYEAGALKTDRTDIRDAVPHITGLLDTYGKLIHDGYVPQEPFLDLFGGVVIMCHQGLKQYIDNERVKRENTEWFAHYFEWLNEQAIKHHKNIRPNDPIPSIK